MILGSNVCDSYTCEAGGSQERKQNTNQHSAVLSMSNALKICEQELLCMTNILLLQVRILTAARFQHITAV